MIKLEVPIEIEENEMTRIKNVFQTQLNYNICKVDIGKEKVVVLTFW